MRIVKAKKKHIKLIDPVEDGVQISDRRFEHPAYSLIGDGIVHVTAGIYLGIDDRYYAWAVLDKRAKLLSTFVAIKKMMEAIAADLELDEVYAIVKRDFAPGHKLVEHLGFELTLSQEDNVDIYRKVI